MAARRFHKAVAQQGTVEGQLAFSTFVSRLPMDGERTLQCPAHAALDEVERLPEVV